MLFLTITCLFFLAASGQSSFLEQFSQSTATVKPLATKNVTLNFTTNTTTMESGKPFLATCNISNFANHASHNYTVWFYTANELEYNYLVAYYSLKVQPSGAQSLLFDTFKPSYSVPGPHYTYPTFDLVVNRTIKSEIFESDFLRNFWCELEDAGKTVAISNVWVNRPIVNLTISAPLAWDKTNQHFTASCTIFHLEKSILKGPEYQVKLLFSSYHSLIPGHYGELATFKVPTSGGPTRFSSNDTGYMGRYVDGEGPRDALPTFDFAYSASGANHTEGYFACQVEDPQSNWKQETSRLVRHL